MSKLLGHRSLETTMIYAKATLETLRGVVQTLDEVREGGLVKRMSSPQLGTSMVNVEKLLKE